MPNTVALQSGSGSIVLNNATGTALAAGTGNVSLTAGSGGIVTTGSDTTGDLHTVGQVTLNTKGGVGSSANPVVFDATQTPASVVVGNTSAPGSGVYLVGLAASPWATSARPAALTPSLSRPTPSRSWAP